MGNSDGRRSRLTGKLLTFLTLVLVLSAAHAAGPPDDAWIESLQGAWQGQNNQTPFGRIPFVLLFERQEDGSMQAFSPLNRETFIKLRFHKLEDGNWMLEESAGPEGLGEQTHDLVPVEGPGEIRRWEYAPDPRFLSVDVAVREEVLFVKVLLRGEEHVVFHLDRQPDDSIPAFREAIAMQSKREPGPGAAMSDFVNTEKVPEAIRAARELVAAQPADAEVHMALSHALGQAIQENVSVNGPRYAFELLATLQKAVKLAPDRPEPYQELVGYYLNAPPIAGGSLDKAEALAHRLQGIDKVAGTRLLGVVQARRSPEGFTP